MYWVTNSGDGGAGVGADGVYRGFLLATAVRNPNKQSCVERASLNPEVRVRRFSKFRFSLVFLGQSLEYYLNSFSDIEGDM